MAFSWGQLTAHSESFDSGAIAQQSRQEVEPVPTVLRSFLKLRRHASRPPAASPRRIDPAPV